MWSRSACRRALRPCPARLRPGRRIARAPPLACGAARAARRGRAGQEELADAGVDADGRSWVRVGSAVELFPDATDVDRSVEFCWPDDTPNRRMVRNVTRPTVTPYLPAPERATGLGVVVCPGGWNHFLAVRHEGEDVAAALAQRGVAAFVLRYRVEPTAPDHVAFEADLAALAADPGRMDEITGRRAPLAVADGSAALDLVRARGGQWTRRPGPGRHPRVLRGRVRRDPHRARGRAGLAARVRRGGLRRAVGRSPAGARCAAPVHRVGRRRRARRDGDPGVPGERRGLARGGRPGGGPRARRRWSRVRHRAARDRVATPGSSCSSRWLGGLGAGAGRPDRVPGCRRR